MSEANNLAVQADLVKRDVEVKEKILDKWPEKCRAYIDTLQTGSCNTRLRAGRIEGLCVEERIAVADNGGRPGGPGTTCAVGRS